MGKAVAEKSKQAREEQKQALSEARAIIANNRLELSRQKKLQKPALRKRWVQIQTPLWFQTQEIFPPTQWLRIVSIFVLMIGIY